MNISDRNVDIDDRYMNISDRNIDIDDRYMNISDRNIDIDDRNIDIDDRNVDIDDRYMNISDRDASMRLYNHEFCPLWRSIRSSLELGRSTGGWGYFFFFICVHIS